MIDNHKIFKEMKRDEYPTHSGIGCAIIGTVIIAGVIIALICIFV